MKRTIAATVAVGALALSACTPAESGAKPEPAPAETVYVEVEPEPEPEPEGDFERTEDFDTLVFDLTWATLDRDEKEGICWGIDVLGKEWTVENWDAETSGMSGEAVYPLFLDVCESEGLL